MTPEQIGELQNTIYRLMFGLDGAALRERFGLPPLLPGQVNADLHGCLGALAQAALGEVQTTLDQHGEPLDFQGWNIVARVTARDVSRKYKRRAFRQGVDFLTGVQR